MVDDEDTYDVPLAQRGTPMFAAVIAPTSRHRDRSPRVRSAVVAGSWTILAALVASVLVLGAVTVLDPDTVAVPTGPETRSPGPSVTDPVESVEPEPPAVLVVAEPAPVPQVRARVRVTTTAGLVRFRLSSPTTGRVRWVVVGPRGRAVDRQRLRIGPRPRVVAVRGLSAGRYTWRVVPRTGGPTRQGQVTVAGVVVAPPPATYTPPVGSGVADVDEPGPSPDRGVRHRDGGREHPPKPRDTHAQPVPSHDVDPDDVPDPVDPSPRGTDAVNISPSTSRT